MSDIVDETLKHWRRTQFEYGKADCLLTIADYIVSRGGTDALAGFRGTYSDMEGAQVHLDACGGPEGLLRLFGLPEIAPEEAQRGDIVVLDTGHEGDTLGALCTGDGIAARTERRSMVELSRRFVRITHAWRVG